MFTKKTLNFVNTDKPCRKKAKEYEKTFTRPKKVDDYEATNECQLCNFNIPKCSS